MSKRKRKKDAPKRKVPALGIVISVIVLTLLLLVVVKPFDTKDLDGRTKSFMVLGGETRPVVNPNQFSGMTRQAYAAAKAIPQILDKVYCYCYCDDPPFNHKSLLSCFVDYHGAS